MSRRSTISAQIKLDNNTLQSDVPIAANTEAEVRAQFTTYCNNYCHINFNQKYSKHNQ